MLKIVVMAVSATLLPLAIAAGSVVANLADLPPLQVDSRADGARPLMFGSYRGLA